MYHVYSCTFVAIDVIEVRFQVLLKNTSNFMTFKPEALMERLYNINIFPSKDN